MDLFSLIITFGVVWYFCNIFIYYYKKSSKQEKLKSVTYTSSVPPSVDSDGSVPRETAKQTQETNHPEILKQPQKTIPSKDNLTEFSLPSRSDKTTVTERSSHRDWKKEDDEDDLRSIRISVGSGSGPKSKSENKNKGKFKKPGEVVTVGIHRIDGGFFYYGGWLPQVESKYNYYGSQTESSLVDDTLPITNTYTRYEDESLGYWPAFNSISPRCRGAYIAWLASKRDSPDTPLGYVFIYFYGLERRVLVDRANGEVNDQELKLIYNEVLRLRKVYGESRSFYGYSTRLLEYITIVASYLFPLEVREIEPNMNSLTFRYELANTVNTGLPISADLALIWLKASPEYRFRTPARRCGTEFEQLFKLKYQQRYDFGFIVKPNKTRLNLDYHPASSTLRGVDSFKVNLPDPSVLSAPVKKLITIAEACTEQLDPYSRYLGKAGSSREDLTGLLLLPDELISVESSPVLKTFKTWAMESIENNNGLVSIVELWQCLGLATPDKLNKKELEFITNLCTRIDIGFAPDPRFHGVKPTPDGNIVLFADGHGEYFEPSGSFNDVSVVMRLGAMMASSDGKVDEEEVIVLQRLIEHDTRLSPIEKKSLHAYLCWRLNTPVNMNGLKARLATVGAAEKEAVSHILVSIALADGTVDPSEVKQLEKLYNALGLDKALVSSDIHRISTTRLEPKTTTSSQGQAKAQSNSFDLDKDLLAIHQSETAQVQTMLGAIFADEAVEETEDEETQQVSSQYPGLQENHQDLFDTLLDKDEWTREQVQELCDKYGLMVDGAIEVINDWAYDQVDAPVFDNDGDILIDREIADELTQMVAGER